MTSDNPSWTTRIAGTVLFLALSAVAVVAHSSPLLPWQLLGSLCAICALVLLAHAAVSAYPFFQGRLRLRSRTIDLGATARRTLPPLLVVAVAVGVLGPLLAGQMPLSHDHPVHLYKAWHFWDEMLLRGRLRGWSSYWFFGYPAEELYPIGPDIWVAAFRAVTLGILSWEATYGLAFVAVFAFSAYAVYSFARRCFGAVAGVVAGLVWVLDMGDYREGGWAYTVDWAVWVQIMAMGFALLALGRLHEVLERGRPRDYATCGLLFCAALLSHPVNVMLLAIALPLLLVARALAEGKPLSRELAGSAGALLLGAMLAGFWFLPMLARSSWTTDIGDLWRPLAQNAKGLLDGTVFANVWPAVVILALAGATVGAAMRRATAIFLLAFAALLLFLCSSTAFEELSLMAISKSFSKIQYQRLVIPAKACLYILAGFAVQQLAASVAAWRRERAASAIAPLEPPPAGASATPAEESAAPAASAGSSARLVFVRRVGLVLLLAAVLAPFARPAILSLQHDYLRTIGGLTLRKQVHYWADYQELLRWSAQRRATSETFYRIAYELDRHNHLMMGAPAYNRTPYYKVGYTPARLFKHVIETTEDPVYRALSVAYIVSLGPLSRPNLAQEVRFGSVFVYRYKDYRPERYTISGPGRAEVKTFEEEKIHLRLTGMSRESRVKVHVANYARWRARLNGRTLAISEAPVYGTAYPMLMEVQAPEDGDLVFDYVMRPVDWLGVLSTLLGLGTVALLIVAPRRERLAARLIRLAPIGRLATRWAAWVALALAAAVVALVVVRLTRGGGGMDERSLAQLLPTARVTQAGRPCRDKRGKAWHCSARSWNYVGPTAEKFNGAFLPCIWAHPVDEGPIVVRFPGVTLGRAIVGHHGIADGAVESFTGGAPVTMEIQVEGRTVERLVRPNEKGWAGFRVDTSRDAGRRADLSLTITTPSSGGRHYCFDAHIEP